MHTATYSGPCAEVAIRQLELNTYDYPVVTVGIAHHGNLTTSRSSYGAAVDFAIEGQTGDENASVIPVVNTGNVPPYNGAVSFTTYRFWAGNVSRTSNDPEPRSLSYFTRGKLAPISDTFAPKTMQQRSEETLPAFEATKDLRQRFYSPLTLRLLDRSETLSAQEVVHHAFFDGLTSALSDLGVWFTGVSPFPISKRFLAASGGASNTSNGDEFPAGDPMGLHPEDVLVVELSLTYSNNASYERIVTGFLDNVNAQIHTQLCAEGLGHLISSSIYLNDADKGQDVFAGYRARVWPLCRGFARSMIRTQYSRP